MMQKFSEIHTKIYQHIQATVLVEDHGRKYLLRFWEVVCTGMRRKGSISDSGLWG